MARNSKVPKLLKLRGSSRELDQGFRRAYLLQLPQEAVDSVRLWPLRHSESLWDVFLSVARPTATVSSALQEREIMANQSHAVPFVSSPSGHGAISLSSLVHQKPELCGAVGSGSPGSAAPWSTDHSSGCFTLLRLCEVCCPGFERILRRFTCFMSKT